ncbi:MAG: hypothetical protein Q8943_17405 [Bacteroidota bacterium]|nr:hypothetical protein [Bacteroidota bacterium]
MLKAADIKKIAGLLKVKAEDLTTAIKDDKEVEFAVPDGLTTLTTDELETRDKNQKEDGIKAGKEIGIKEVREKAGLESSVGKDPEKIAAAIGAKALADAKIEPDKKVKLLEEQVAQLQGSLTKKDGEIATIKQTASSIAKDRKLLAAFPKNRADILSDEQFLTLVKGELSIDEVDGKEVVKKGGEVLRDAATKNPLTLEAAVTSLFKESKGWLAEGGAGGGGASGGRGGGDGGKQPTFTKKSEVIKHYEDQGKSVNGAAGVEIANKLSELKKANPDFDLVN